MSASVSQRISRNGFKNQHLSVSRLRRYEACPASFHEHYVLENKSAGGQAADFGVVLHAVLERVMRWVVAEEFSGQIPEDIVIDIFRDEWAKGGSKSVREFMEGLTVLRTYLRDHGVVDSMKILDVEREFNIEVEDFIVNGKIDRVDKISDDHIAIIDYKSNRLLYSKEELEDDLQMTVYGIVARQLYPWAKRFSFVFHMLRHGELQGTERTAGQLDDGRGYVVALGRKTETDTTWKATPNMNCGYCDYRSKCEPYLDLLKTDTTSIVHVATDDLEAVGVERNRLAKLAKFAYARLKELDDVIKAKMKLEGEVDLAGTHYRMVDIFSTRYPVVKTVALLERLDVPRAVIMGRVLSVDKKALEEVAVEYTSGANAAMLRAELEAVGNRSFDYSKIDARPIKGTKAEHAETKPTKSRKKG